MDRTLTINGFDARLWMDCPLPLAEVGSQLDASRADYLERLFGLAEDALTLAGALALARLSREATQARADAAAQLVRPSMGSRLALLRALEAYSLGIAGWRFDGDVPDLMAVVELGSPGSKRKRPRLLDVESPAQRTTHGSEPREPRHLELALQGAR